MKLLDNYAQFNPSPLTMKEMLEFGRTATEVESYEFLKQEIPVRLSNIMKEVTLLPTSLLQMHSIPVLQEWYAQTFTDVIQFKERPGDKETLLAFNQTLEKITKRHETAVQSMAQGALQLKDSHTLDIQTQTNIQLFLTRFYMSRISIRMLMDQHAMLFEPDADRSARVGIIDPHCNIGTVVKHAFNQASDICEEYYLCAPELDMTIHNNIEPGKHIETAYTPHHLHYIFFELFKNSMRATVETTKQPKELPDINVLIVSGEHDIAVKISDQGGGIPRHITNRLFQFLHSTATRPSIQPKKAPLAGYGYGLPLSRLYARYFHGDLVITSCEGYGTDTVLFLKKNINEAKELLPIFNQTASNQYKAAVPTADWTDAFSAMNSQYHPAYLTKEKE